MRVEWFMGDLNRSNNKLPKDSLKIRFLTVGGNLLTSNIKQPDFKIESMGTTTPEHDKRIAEMTFSSVYPHYVTKVEKKGKTIAELHQVIEWLTGFDEAKVQELIAEKVTFKTFFQRATINPNAHLIKGLICGYRVEDITTPLTQQARYLDKLIDELARGKKMESILRKP